MSAYLYSISDAHKDKLQRLADRNEITVECALNGIVCYLKSTNTILTRPAQMKDFITGADIEDVIDRIFV